MPPALAAKKKYGYLNLKNALKETSHIVDISHDHFAFWRSKRSEWLHNLQEILWTKNLGWHFWLRPNVVWSICAPGNIWGNQFPNFWRFHQRKTIGDLLKFVQVEQIGDTINFKLVKSFSLYFSIQNPKGVVWTSTILGRGGQGKSPVLRSHDS